MVVRARQLGPALRLRPQHRQADQQDHDRRRPGHRHRARRRQNRIARRRSTRPDAGRGSVLPSLLRIGAGRKGMEGAHARKAAIIRFSCRPTVRYFIDTYSTPDVPPTVVLRDCIGQCRDAARTDGHLATARHRLEAADAIHREGARRQDGSLRLDVPSDELRLDEEVSDHQPHLSRPADGQRRIAQLQRRARRRAGARRARLRRGHHRRHGNAGPVEELPRRVLRRDGATTRCPIRWRA